MKSGPKVAIVLSVVMVLSILAPPVVASSHDDIPDNETFTTNNVEVWEESIFTLRHDFEDAPTAVETGDFRAGLGSGGETTLNRDYLGVRTAGDEVTLTYDPGRAALSGADLTDNEVQVIAARVTGSGEPVTTFTEATDLISQENANSNATFEMVESGATLASGETTFTHTGSAGHYVYFVVDKATGNFSVDNSGDIAIDTGTPTIIGVEQITFQRGSPGSVSAPAIAEPGENLSFDVDTTSRFAEDNVTHTVLVYNESTFTDVNQGKFTIEVSDRSSIDENFNLTEDAELFHEINEVNGVADVEDGIEINGIDISDGRVSRAVSLGSVVDFVAEDINGNSPDTTATGDVRLDASVTADAQQNRDHTVTVETADNWEPGTYRYVYIGALESNASAVTTSTGTVSIQEATAPSISDFTATNPSAQNIVIDFDSDEELQNIDVSISGEESATLTEADFEKPANGGGTYTATYEASNNGDYTATLDTAEDAAGNDGSSGISDTVTISADSKSAPVSNGQATATFASGGSIQSAEISGLPANVGKVTVRNRGTNNPSSNPAPNSNVRGYFDIEPDTSVNQPVTVTVTVQDSTVAGITPALYHDPGNGYTELTTTTTTTASGTQLTGTASSLSPFAIAAESTSTNTGGGGGGGGGSSSATFTVSDLTPQDVEVTQGEEITVTATVTTGSFLEDTQDVEFRIDGETIATQSVSLQDQQSTTVEFTGIDTSNLEGEYEHGVFTDDDDQTATLTVTPPTDDGDDGDDEPADGTDQGDDSDQDDDQPADGDTGTDGETDDGTPGFGPLVALIALVAAALLAVRREH